MDTHQLIGGFKERFEKFVYLYKELKAENLKIISENNELKDELKEKEELIKELESKLEIKELAEAFTGDTGNIKDAKVKINRIVREIDNCIALLNR